MKLLSRVYFFWISALLLSAISTFVAYRFFHQAFPFIHVNITMDREQALKEAKNIAEKYRFGPSDYQQAVTFHTDAATKRYVELEVGGRDALNTMIDENLYLPYTWRVRHFKEYDINEVFIIFTPEGKPYGFIEKVSENIPGEQLTEHDAQARAEKDATEYWNTDFSNYTLSEHSQVTTISNRIDHTFIYKRISAKIGDDYYRLKIVVRGDKVTELQHFIRIPEAFDRRYNEMRSANTLIWWIANLLMILLYAIGGCCFGFYWLLKKQYYLIKQPIIWGLFLGIVGIMLVSLNNIPHFWMNYNNAQSIATFLTQLILSFFSLSVIQTCAYVLIIMTAEGLTRAAFGHQPQLWKVWSRENAASYSVLYRTIGGYISVGFLISFCILFYTFCIRYLGWWIPSDIRFDPNVLATYVPWLSAIGKSLNAGFIEECLFRAIPLAGAALLGSYFSRRNQFIAVAFVLQALIFGAAHANYPMQPAYARLIELLIPSFFWGASYLAFGLLPNIIVHFVYDVFWFSLPIFISQAPSALGYKIIILFIALIPLFIVVYARFKSGKWSHLSENAFNRSWQPSVSETKNNIEDNKEFIEPHTLTKQTKKIVIALGIIGSLLWFLTTPFEHDGVTIDLSQSQAIEQSNNFLHRNSISLEKPWQTLPLFFNHYSRVPDLNMQHAFIWQEGNKDLYYNLLGSYLHPAHWTIRYAQFEGDIIERAEEHKIMLYNPHTIYRYLHQLPEARAGVSLTQQQAREIAYKRLQEEFSLGESQVIEIATIQTQLPQRINWKFTFSDPNIYPLPQGQARIEIVIAGDKVISSTRFIYVPEEWKREKHNQQTILKIILAIISLLFCFFILMALFKALRYNASVIFSRKLFYFVLLNCIGIALISIINAWASVAAAFNTSISLSNQIFQTLTGIILSSLFKITGVSLMITVVLSYRAHHLLSKNWLNVITGLSLGLFYAGLVSAAKSMIPVNLPLWPNYNLLTNFFPLLGSACTTIMNYFFITAQLSLTFIVAARATQNWKKNDWLLGILFSLYGMTLIPLSSLKAIPLWISIGSFVGLVLLSIYRYIIRYDYSLIPLATISTSIIPIIQQGIFNAHPYAITEMIINSSTVIIIGFLWYNYLHRR